MLANAGTAKDWGPVATTPISQIREHLEVNTLGALIIFQATWTLLEAAKQPKFVMLSIGLGSLSDMDKYPMPGVAYGVPRVAVNFITEGIHQENLNLIAFPVALGMYIETRTFT